MLPCRAYGVLLDLFPLAGTYVASLQIRHSIKYSKPYFAFWPTRCAASIAELIYGILWCWLIYDSFKQELESSYVE